MQAIEQLFEVNRRLRPVIEDKNKIRDASQPQTRAQLVPNIRCGGGKPLQSSFLRTRIAEHTYSYARVLQISAQVDTGYGDEADSRVSKFFGNQHGNLSANLVCKAVKAV